MNNNSYKLKYYKYKNKYLELKQKTLINQEGGIFPAQTGMIGFFIDNPPKFGYNEYLTINVERKQIFGGLGRNKLMDLTYNQLCELSCAVVKQDTSAKEWLFPITKRSNHYDDETLKYKRNSNFIASIKDSTDVENTKKEVLSCLSDLNKIIKKMIDDPKISKFKKDNLGYINRKIIYCIVCKVNYREKNEILAIYEYHDKNLVSIETI